MTATGPPNSFIHEDFLRNGSGRPAAKPRTLKDLAEVEAWGREAFKHFP